MSTVRLVINNLVDALAVLDIVDDGSPAPSGPPPPPPSSPPPTPPPEPDTSFVPSGFLVNPTAVLPRVYPAPVLPWSMIRSKAERKAINIAAKGGLEPAKKRPRKKDDDDDDEDEEEKEEEKKPAKKAKKKPVPAFKVAEDDDDDYTEDNLAKAKPLQKRSVNIPSKTRSKQKSSKPKQRARRQ